MRSLWCAGISMAVSIEPSSENSSIYADTCMILTWPSSPLFHSWVPLSLCKLSGVKLCTLFGVQPERERPLRKPVAMPERSAIHFGNAKTPQIERLTVRCKTERFSNATRRVDRPGHRESLSEWPTIRTEPESPHPRVGRSPAKWLPSQFPSGACPGPIRAQHFSEMARQHVHLVAV
jgi:hypothetical protein